MNFHISCHLLHEGCQTRAALVLGPEGEYASVQLGTETSDLNRWEKRDRDGARISDPVRRRDVGKALR